MEGDSLVYSKPGDWSYGTGYGSASGHGDDIDLGQALSVDDYEDGTGYGCGFSHPHEDSGTCTGRGDSYES